MFISFNDHIHAYWNRCYLLTTIHINLFVDVIPQAILGMLVQLDTSIDSPSFLDSDIVSGTIQSHIESGWQVVRSLQSLVAVCIQVVSSIISE